MKHGFIDNLTSRGEPVGIVFHSHRIKDSPTYTL